MARSFIDDLAAFAEVAEARSFTRAASRLGMSQPALSRVIGGLEARLGVRLLHRTTRSVAPTAAGAALLRDLRPALTSIDDALARLHGSGPDVTGSVKLSASRHGYDTILRPALPSFMALHPRVDVEVMLDDAFVDIVARGCDAGLRLGGFVEKDMVAVRVGSDVAFAVVASPSFCHERDLPGTPQALAEHRCIAFRAPRSGAILPWAFERRGSRFSVRVTPSLVLDDGKAILDAALDGVGFAYLFLDQVEEHLAARRLIRILAEYCPELPGYHLYHTSRRQQPPALAALIGHLRRTV